MTNPIAIESDTIDQETLERKLNEATKEFEKAKENKDGKDKELTEASKGYKEAMALYEKDKAAADNISGIFGATGLIKPLQEKIKELKDKGLGLYGATKKLLNEANAALEEYSDLENRIKDIKDAEGPLSPDLEKDSAAVKISLTKSYTDTVLAYKNTAIVLKSILGAEQTLMAIHEQLSKLETNEGGIKTYFDGIAKKSKSKMQKSEKEEQSKLQKSKDAHNTFNETQKALSSLKELKVLLDSISI